MRAPQAPRLPIRQLARVSVVALLMGLLHVVSAAPASAAAPEGYVDYIASESPGYVTVAGWTRDPDNPSVSLNVHFYVGTTLFVIPANQYRPDPTLQGNYGFRATVAVNAAATYSWSATGMDSQGVENQQLINGNGFIAVAEPSPRGSVDAVSSPGHRQISVSGWAGDPNNTAATLGIQVFIGGPAGSPGAEMHVLATSVARPDASGFGPKPGFASTLTTSKTGRQDVHFYAVNHPGSPGTNTHLGKGTVDIYVDTTPPETKITSAPETATPTDVIRVEFSASEPNATFQCRWDAGTWAACAGSSTVSLTPGNHLIAVRASDVYGNTDPTPATWMVAVSANPPPPPPVDPNTPTVGARSVKRKSKLRIDVDPDSAENNYHVVIQRKVGKKWRRVARVRTRGPKDAVVVNLGRGKYRVRLPKSALGASVTSNAVRLRR